MRYIRKFLVPAAIPTLFGTLIVLLSLNTCQKFDPEGFLYFETDTTEALGGGKYTLKGFMDDIGEDAITEHGFCWSEQRNPTTDGSSTQLGSRNSKGSFSSTISGLSSNTTYYYRAYVITSFGTEYANEKSFITESAPPTVNTSVLGNITSTSAQGGGEVTDDGGGTVTARGVCWSTSSEPTTADYTTVNGSGIGVYSSTLIGLDPFTTYYVRSYATNSEWTAYGEEINFKTRWDNSSIMDYDGNEYNTIQIGDQVWMAENLKVTHFEDGAVIHFVESVSEWETMGITEKAYGWYDNNESNKNIYGALYSWAAAMKGAGSSSENPSGVQGVCPSGWHLPSDAEWKQVEMNLGMSQGEADGTKWRGTDEGGKMKATGTALWDAPNMGANNESGFSALPGGYIQDKGTSIYLGCYAVFWTATEYSSIESWHRNLLCDYTQVYRYFYPKMGGFSVRCIMDD